MTVRFGIVFVVSITLFCSLLASPTPVRAQTADAPLSYAGFAFAGDYENRGNLYPRSAAISEELGPDGLDTILRNKLVARPDLHQRVTLDQVDGKLDISSVAFALVHEGAEVQRIDGKFWVILTMQANVLAFNMKSSSVVASYPVRVRYTKVQDTPPSDADLHDMVLSAYTSPVARENIFDQWLNQFGKATLRTGAIRYLRVTDVNIAPEAEQLIAASGKSAKVVSNQVANFLEAAIGEAAGVSLVPNSVGEAIGSKIPYRFSNGTQVMLALPEPDFQIGFLLRGFASRKIEKPEYVQGIYRVKAAVTLKQPDLDRVFIDENIYATHTVTLPRRAEAEVTDWEQYYKTLQGLVFGLARQMAQVDDAWLIENASRGLEAKPGFVRTNQLLQELK